MSEDKRTRFVVSKTFGPNHLTIGDGETAVKLPVDGIAGLAAYGLAALINAQAFDGPKTLEYYTETAQCVLEYLGNGWKAGDSSGVMKKRFQLARALWQISGKKARKAGRDPLPFAKFVERVMELSDTERSIATSTAQYAAVIATFNSPKSESAIDGDVQKMINSLSA